MTKMDDIKREDGTEVSAGEGGGAVSKARATSYSKLFDLFAGWAVVLFAFLFPLFVTINSAVDDQIAKKALLVFFVVITLALWLLARLEAGSISLPSSPLSWSVLLIVNLYL